MALAFNCTNCGERIIVKYVKVGEESKCYSCGTINSVPTEATKTDEIPEYEKEAIRIHENASDLEQISQEFAGKTAWNPRAIGWLGFFFTFFPAGIMLAFNWEKLGKPEKKRPTIFFTTLFFTIYLILLVWFLDVPVYVSLLLYLIMSIGFYRSQRKLYKDFIRKGGKKESFKKPIWIGIGSLVGVLILFGGIGAIEGLKLKKKYDQGIEYYNIGQFEKAKEIMSELADDEIYEASALYALCCIALAEGEIDHSFLLLRNLTFIAPDDLNVKLLLTRMVENYNWYFDGEVTLYYESGNIKEIRSYKNKEMNGKVVRYYEDGSLKGEFLYTDNLRKGPAKEYHKNGALSVEGNFADDFRTGKHIYYTADGKIKKYGYFNQDSASTSFVFPNDSLKTGDH
jgi:MORN repeat variant